MDLPKQQGGRRECTGQRVISAGMLEHDGEPVLLTWEVDRIEQSSYKIYDIRRGSPGNTEFRFVRIDIPGRHLGFTGYPWFSGADRAVICSDR